MYKSSFLLTLILLMLYVIESQANSLEIYDKTIEIVTQKFYDQSFRGLPWSKMTQDYREKLTTNSSEEELKQTINMLLSHLKASHTEFMSSSDQSYWGLQSIFSGNVDGAQFQQIGAWFIKINDKWFVQNVFSGSPAHRAGILSGDEVISVNGSKLNPVDSFLNNEKNVISLRRTKTGNPIQIIVESKLESLQRTLLNATTNSYRIIKHRARKIAYFHLWAGTNDSFKDALAKAALQASIESDVFILDLRDGFGGAYPEYLAPFFKQKNQNAFYSKPMIVLINHGVRSGKEWIAHILKQKGRATLIGSNTRGYFLSGQPFEIVPNRFMLYLAVQQDETKPKLENIGVSPHILFDQELEYTQGADPILNEALNFIINKL
jgi:carboxyl-terminal processing protease